MKLVREDIEKFTRGGDPYRKMEIGKYSPVNVGNRFRLLTTLRWNEPKWMWVKSSRSNCKNDDTKYLCAENIFTIYDIIDDTWIHIRFVIDNSESTATFRIDWFYDHIEYFEEIK